MEKRTAIGYRLNKNGKPFLIKGNEIIKTVFEGNSFKYNGEYYFFVAKRINTFIYEC